MDDFLLANLDVLLLCFVSLRMRRAKRENAVRGREVGLACESCQCVFYIIEASGPYACVYEG